MGRRQQSSASEAGHGMLGVLGRVVVGNEQAAPLNPRPTPLVAGVGHGFHDLP